MRVYESNLYSVNIDVSHQWKSKCLPSNTNQNLLEITELIVLPAKGYDLPGMIHTENLQTYN